MTITPTTADPVTDPREAEAKSAVASFAGEYPFEPNFLELSDGTYLHYVDEGARTASPVLCVHGNPTWSFYYRKLLSGLAPRRRVLAVDHVGCGLSDKPQSYDYTLEQHAKNLEELVLTLDLRDVTLVVHDWGGAIGMGLARRHPERIARLVVLNTAAFRSKRMPLRIAACRWPLVGPLAVRGFGAFSRAALTMATERGISEEARRAYMMPHDGWHDRVATLAFVRDIPMRESHPSYDELVAIEESLASFADRPMAILWGERDWCFSPEFRAEWQERFPNAEVHVFDDVGHWIMEDAGDEVLERVEAFLDANDA